MTIFYYFIHTKYLNYRFFDDVLRSLNIVVIVRQFLHDVSWLFYRFYNMLPDVLLRKVVVKDAHQIFIMKTLVFFAVVK